MKFYSFRSYITLKNVRRGVCIGLGVSLKSHTVKYLLCSLNDEALSPEFSLNFSAVTHMQTNEFHLSTLRPVLPKSHVKLFKNIPVYTQSGTFVGGLTKLKIRNNTLVRLYTQSTAFSPSDIYACSDAIILKTAQPYPLGQRIPAMPIPAFSSANHKRVTKSILHSAIQNDTLIKFTLSLPPFSLL